MKPYRGGLMMDRIRNILAAFRRRVIVQSNLRVIDHNRPGQFVVYTLTDRGPWTRIYTGPLDYDRMASVGWARREGPWEAFWRALRTLRGGR